MKKTIFWTMLILTFLMIIQFSSAVSTIDAINNYEIPKATYDTSLSPAYLKNNVSDESIDTKNGKLTVFQTDYFLPGKNGLNLEIKRIMEGSTQPYKFQVAEININGTPNYYDYVDNDYSETFYERRYNLGVGTRFSFPTIEIAQNGDGSYYRRFHSESGAVYSLGDPAGGIYPINNHPVKDFSIEGNVSYRNKSGLQSVFVMNEKSGKKTYFDSEGKIIGKCNI